MRRRVLLAIASVVTSYASFAAATGGAAAAAAAAAARASTRERTRSNDRGNVSELLDNLLRGYDNSVRPDFGGPPTTVEVDIMVRSMGPISEVDMTYSMDCYFRQSWVDRRLAFKGGQETLALSVSMLARIWKPDTYFYNGKQSYLHTITSPNKFVRLFQDGRVLYSSRLTIKAGCPMNLEDFPMDTQRCPLKFGSFGYTTRDLVYEWNNARRVAIAEDMKLSQFDLVADPTANRSNAALLSQTEYSVLLVSFHLQRHMGNFLIQVYGPCVLLVVLSWVSFWLNREATADRVSLGITTVLTMTFLGLEARTDLPKVPYPTALDFFVFLSFAFIFATIIQFAVVHCFTKYGSGECYFGEDLGDTEESSSGGDDGDDDDDRDDEISRRPRKRDPVVERELGFPVKSKSGEKRMRSRSNSGVRLDYYQRMVQKIIMNHQNPVTGLFPASTENDHAWIRDNVYCILAVWGLSMAYKKIADADEDRAKTYELEQSCVKLMRGLLTATMRQKEKVEKFKTTQNPLDALHAKYSSVTGQSVVGDSEWGHLQIDAVSLYLLILAQMTASGLQIIFNLDEVAFIQNLVFYIESAYCTPDYGVWERGDKTNHGLPELNASSIGMAKAALEAMNELDLFGARGGPTSVIHVLADEAQKCQAVLQSMLPRESNSKELDSGLLSVVSFPAFAVDEPNLIRLTRDAVTKKLQGRYGCKRFLRDGYRTPKEDPNRLYYEPWELRMFENIECEWPLFFCYLILDYCFQGNQEGVAEYTRSLESIMIKGEDGIKLVPELYAVSGDKVNAEYAEPGTAERVALGRCPFMWAQSLYILGKLLQEGFLAVGELDPLNRRLCSEKKPDVVVQVVILAEDAEIREKIAQHDIHVQTIAEVAPIEVQPAKVLSHLYTYLGRNKKLGLSGRKSRDVGILSTSKLYSLNDKVFAFTPQNFDSEEFYVTNDAAFLADTFTTNLAFVTINWKHMLGRPTVTLVATRNHLDQGKIPLAMITTMKKLKSGYINGTRVSLGNMSDFLSTSCITNLSFLGSAEDGRPDKLNPQVHQYLEEHLMRPFPHRTGLLNRSFARSRSTLRRRMSVKGAIKKTRSIAVEPELPIGRQESEILGMAAAAAAAAAAASAGGGGGEDGRRPSTMGQNFPSIEVTDTGSPVATSPSSNETSSSVRLLNRRTPSPIEEPMPWKSSPKPHRHRVTSETQYADTEVEELFAMLREAESLEEQGDILQYLVDSQGLYFNTGMLEEGHPVLIKDLLKGLYEKACQQKMWGIVRHTAGMLGKRVEDLAKAVTDLLVRQKQVTVGMPPSNEHTIVAPLPENELRSLIHQAYGDDESTAMLTQELLVYLAMFIRTEPQLFHEMLRLRVGLIIQVMATELSRTLICTGEEASEHLLNLSPFEMKNLLHHIMSGKEFAISSVGRGNFSVISCKSNRLSKKSQIGSFLNVDQTDSGEMEPDRQGQWLRRRRLDGALNRVPRDFYPRVWQVLERCQGLVVEGKVLRQNLTQEMTSGELKFALAFETVLNTIPQPEYRQLIVEALMVLTLVTEYNVVSSLGGLIAVEHLVHKANAIFLEDQMKIDGDATLCCAKPKEERETTAMGTLLCGGAAYICQHFYDSAPSGSYGTMTYITRAIASLLNCLPKDGDIECSIT